MKTIFCFLFSIYTVIQKRTSTITLFFNFLPWYVFFLWFWVSRTMYVLNVCIYVPRGCLYNFFVKFQFRKICIFYIFYLYLFVFFFSQLPAVIQLYFQNCLRLCFKFSFTRVLFVLNNNLFFVGNVILSDWLYNLIMVSVLVVFDLLKLLVVNTYPQ